MSVIWKDGEFLDGLAPSLFAQDCGIAGGLGVFDSMLAKDGVLIDGAEHYERLVHDADIVLGYNKSWLPGFAAMSEVWQPLLSQNNLTKGHARLRTVITGGFSQGPLTVSDIPTILVTAGKSGAPENASPVRCAVVRDFPRIARCVLENCKRLDYTRAFAARRRAVSMGAEEAILINTDGNIACAATSNIYIREGGMLITPPLKDGVLAGVTRRLMLERGEAIEESISEERLKAAEAVYITNSFTGLRPVTL